MTAVVSTATAFLAGYLIMVGYGTLSQALENESLGSWGRGAKNGLLVTSLYLFSIFYFFASAGTFWIGVGCVIAATIIIIQVVYGS
jgi:hypothetical protein